MLGMDSCGSVKKISMSSANDVILCVRPNTLISLMLLFALIRLSSGSRVSTNNSGESGHSCLITSDRWPLTRTLACRSE